MYNVLKITTNLGHYFAEMGKHIIIKADRQQLNLNLAKIILIYDRKIVHKNEVNSSVIKFHTSGWPNIYTLL